MMLLPPGPWGSLGVKSALFSQQTFLPRKLLLGLIRSDQIRFCYMVWLFFFLKGLQSSRLTTSPIHEEHMIVVIRREQSGLARCSCSCFNVAVGLLVKFLSCPLLMMAFTLVHGTANVLGMSLSDRFLSTVRPCTCFINFGLCRNIWSGVGSLTCCFTLELEKDLIWFILVSFFFCLQSHDFLTECVDFYYLL